MKKVRSFKEVFDAVESVLESAEFREVAELYGSKAFEDDDYYVNDPEALLEGYTPEEAFKMCYFSKDYNLEDGWVIFDSYGHLISFEYEDQAFEYVTGKSVVTMIDDIAEAVALYLTDEAGENIEIPKTIEEIELLGLEFNC